MQSLTPGPIQFKVDGIEIKENWLSDYSRNLVEYRSKLHQAMSMAQQRYLGRKKEKKVHNQRENLVPLEQREEFLTVYPKNPSLALNKRRMVKEGRGQIRRVIEHYFVIDNQLITFFDNERDIDFKKNSSLEGAFVFVESFDNFDPDSHTWHDRSCIHRVQIGLPQRQLSPIYFYTNDLNEAKILAARVYISSTSKKAQISDMIRKLSLLEVIFRFQQVWRCIFKVYEKRLLQMISFQILGINLNELATTAWLQREKLFRFWSGQVLKREKIPLLRSTFRFGQIKRQLDPSLYKSSLMVREQILKLVRAFKNRRLQRHSAIQQDIQTLLEEEEAGTLCSDIKIKVQDLVAQEQQPTIYYNQAVVKTEGQRFLVIQNSSEERGMKNVEFYERNPPVKFQLEQISCIATDFNMFDKRQQIDEYTVRIYGRNILEYSDPKCDKNLTPDELGLDVLRKVSQDRTLYQIKIHSVELSISFAKQFSLKADIRVKLRQGRTADSLDQSFYINSRPYRISVPGDKSKGRMVLKGQDYTFLVDRLNQFNLEETFKLSVVIQRNNVPVTQFMKEFLHEEEFISEKVFKYEEGDNLEVKCSDTDGNKMKVKFSVSKVKNLDGQQPPSERDGLRLLVGRYIIYQKRIAFLRCINRDLTVDLQNLSTGTVKNGVKMRNLKMIERSGVSIYDLKNLPAAVTQSKYLWVMEFKTRNKRIINLISSGVQNKQTLLSFGQRSYSRDKKRDIEGKIVISVMETLDIKIPETQCNLFSRITVKNIKDSLEEPERVYETTPINDVTNPTWVSNSNPNGFIVDVGTFFKENVYSIKFELINKEPQRMKPILKMLEKAEQDAQPYEEFQIIGSVEMSSTDFISITEPGQERCLILEGDKIAYSFLIIQSLFIPTNVTRIEYQIMPDYSLFLSPENYFHYQYLQKQHEIDTQKYAVPLSKFHPNYLEKMVSAVDDQQKQSPMLFDIASQAADRKSSPSIAVTGQGRLCSIEERISISLRSKNSLRPDIEEGILLFKYLWKQRVFQARQAAFNELQTIFWNRFLTDMDVLAHQHPFNLAIKEDIFLQDGDIAILDYENTFLHNQNEIQIPGEQIFDWLKKKAGQNATNILDAARTQNQAEIKQFNLMFFRIWGDETSQYYADTYYLIQAGIPAEHRVRIWRDLFKIEILEHDEIRVLKKKHSKQYDQSRSVYENYKDMAMKQDCLAFRQIDEDIEQYQFPHLYSENQSKQERQLILKEEKRKMRNILRVLVLWSRNRKNEGSIISFSYTSGLMNIIQRLLTIAEEEDAYWLLNGIVRMIPRLFSTDESCLIGGRISVMRNEMTAFKAILRENLPKICDKLRILGLPVDHLIYNSITSFYAHFFSSEVVLRLWDLIIFNLANQDKIAKKRAVWYVMAPAYWILRERQDDILKATTIQQVDDLYNNGCSITYNPDWIVNDLKNLIKDIFVMGGGQTQSSASRLSLQFQKLIKRDAPVLQSIDKAKNLEDTRKKYEADLSLIFNSIEEENKQIGILLDKSVFKGSMKQGGQKGNVPVQQFLDYTRWRLHIMDRFKKVAIKQHQEEMHDNLYLMEEPEGIINKNDLDLSMINIYLHKILNLTGIKQFRMRVYYGQIAEDGSFQSVEERYEDDEIFNDVTVNRFYDFEYLIGYNHMKIEIFDSTSKNIDASAQATCDLLIDLRELNSNRFIKKHYQMRNENLIENLDSFRYPFTVFVVSVFLQSHTAQQHELLMEKRNTAMSQFINSIKRKLPDRIDIFNKKNETDFVEIMRGDFRRIIREEFEALSCFLPEEIARNTINDNFNYTEEDGSDFGDISLPNLQYLIKQCFFSDWVPLMENIYKTFTKGIENSGLIMEQSMYLKNSDEKNKQQQEDDGNLSEVMHEETHKFTQFNETLEMNAKLEESRSLEMLDKIRNIGLEAKQQINNQDDSYFNSRAAKPTIYLTTNRKNGGLPFSLRNFLVSLVLMSHCTINEKFDILYDLFDWNDGVADGLEMNSMFLLIKTIFERNLYYWPSHELFNLVEMSFDMSVSSIYQALWTSQRDVQNLNPKKFVKLSNVMSDPSVLDSSLSIDVTEEIQETLNSYQSMFGNKVIDFNFDSSAFKNIGTLIKNGNDMVRMTSKLGATQSYKLIIFYQVSSERYMFEVNYDRYGQLVRHQDMIEKDDIDEYLKRNIHKLYLQGRSQGISKHEFLTKTVQIPFLHDLVRVETLYRDRLQSTLQKKKKLSKELVVLINEEEYLLIFRFQSRVMHNVEGEVQKLDSRTFRILMKESYEQDVISDVRERINRTVKAIIETNPVLKGALAATNSFYQQVEGLRDFFIRDGQSKWKVIKEFDRLVQFQENESANDTEIIMKMEQSKHQGDDTHLKEEERDLAAFDCYSLYKHCDMSNEWRLCKIMQKESIAIINPAAQKPSDLFKVQSDGKNKGDQHNFTYWIEFLHHRKTGQKLWLKRRREEILMSARYAREQQRNYEQETLKFVRETYREAFAESRLV